ncbi:MAG: carboxypeptidase-like regulatory domain-containing protein [Prevotellaceae bacterium]|jgi:hypothetical protein|nr:carboxypeptidase-like regulatory domain-containing protein [Prevotellaceae bacterium]
MKRNIFIIIAILAFANCLAQTDKKLFVADSITKEPVEYTCIVFTDTIGGTYSNDKGVFYIPQNIKQIEISSIGYLSKIITLQKNIDTIFLSPQVYEISEAKVSPSKKKRKPVELGYASENKNNILFSHNRSGDEIAVYLPIGNENNIFRLMKQVIIRGETFKNRIFDGIDYAAASIFKINFYRVIENKKIGEIINTEDIVFTSDILKSKTKLDVSKYNIYMPENGIFVAVEWVGRINPDTKEIIINEKGGVQPYIRAAWKIPNTVVYEKRRFINSNTWQRVDKNHEIVKGSKSFLSYILKEDDIYTPLISIVLE